MPSRINAIDAIRGFCLLNIFVNHLTLGWLQVFSPSRIAFSDSAEAFVFLAGISSFLAYGPRDGVAFFPARVGRMWQRAWTIWLFHGLVAAGSIVVLVASQALAAPDTPSGPAALVERHGPLAYAWHVLTMQQPVGLAVILRLYVALLLLAPVYVWLAGKRFWLPLVPAGAVWLLAGHFGWEETASLTGDRIVLAILPWNFVFAAGVALGAGIVRGVRLPTPPLLTALAVALALAPIVCVMAMDDWPALARWIATRHEDFWTGASKPLQSPLRVAHVFALAYLVIALRNAPLVRMIHQVSPDNPLCRLGRRSLPVFAGGAVLATAGNEALRLLFASGAVPQSSPGALAIELATFAVSAVAMLWIADRGRAPAKVTARLAPVPTA